MKAPYAAEIASLPLTYAAALGADVNSLEAALRTVGAGPALFVGAGGAMALAQLAARLHEERFRQPARACTALELLEAPTLARRGAVMFSSSAKHPDAQRVLGELRRLRFQPSVLLTHRAEADVTELTGPDCQVVTLPALPRPDGFLATGSILQGSVLLLRAFDGTSALPATLDIPDEVDRLRDEVLVLYPPALLPVATDLEVRLVESGLAAVQLADYRNFAHGRHTGFARREASVTVIGLLHGASRGLGDATLGLLPKTADIRRWDGGETLAEATVRLLVRSIHLVGWQACGQGVDPARPKVPTFGRRLYRLPLARLLESRLSAGVERKVLAAGAGNNASSSEAYTAAAERWSETISQLRFGGLVLDYDGTVCWTQRRFDLPEKAVCTALTEFLERGCVLGFASGRGRSLYGDLRKWVPDCYHDQVVVGLYNGAVVMRLGELLPDLRAPSAWTRTVERAIEQLPVIERLTVVSRASQVTLAPSSAMHLDTLAALARECLVSASVSATVAVSGHSVDIVPLTATKLAVADRVEAVAGRPALAIGDQGQLGGNDYALLARGPATLTVDRCSADPNSCWFVGSGELVGPALLLRLLAKLRPRRGGLALSEVGVR